MILPPTKTLAMSKACTETHGNLEWEQISTHFHIALSSQPLIPAVIRMSELYRIIQTKQQTHLTKKDLGRVVITIHRRTSSERYYYGFKNKGRRTLDQIVLFHASLRHFDHFALRCSRFG